MLTGQIKKVREIWHRDIISMRSMVKSSFSFIQNQMMISQNIDWDTFDTYIYFKEVHSLLELHKIEDQEVHLCRVGGNADGGYIMAKPYSDERIAYSLGIGKNVSWDRQMADEGYRIYQYDHTIKKLPQAHTNFCWKKIGVTADRDSNNMRTLKSLMKENGHEKKQGMILKMDIEGCEWDVLNKINIETLNQFDQIAIEFHRLSDIKMRNRILGALKKISGSFAMIHIHGCNYSWVNYCNCLATPDTFEATLVNRNKYHVVKKSKILPCGLDWPDNPDTPEIWIGYWNCF